MVQQAVYFLLALVPRHCRLDVAQHLPAASSSMCCPELRIEMQGNAGIWLASGVQGFTSLCGWMPGVPGPCSAEARHLTGSRMPKKARQQVA